MAGEVYDSWPAGATATMNVTYTQANAAGGAVVCEISPGTGNEFIIQAWAMVNSGTHGITAHLETSAGGTVIALLQSIGSGAATIGYMSPGGVAIAAPTTTNVPTGIGYPLIVSGIQALRLSNPGAGAQNDTFQVVINIRCKGSMPIVTHANSTNPANVSVTAGAESFTTV